jgi:hypothetical protein
LVFRTLTGLPPKTVFPAMIVPQRNPDRLVWPFLTDVDFVQGPLPGVGSYTVSGAGSLFLAGALDISADNPLPGTGMYYLVKPRGTCGSWQTAPGAEPLRDAFLPP